MVNSKDYRGYLFIILLVLVIYISYLIVKPFIAALLASAVLAYIFYPLYVKLNKKLKRKNVSAFIISLLIIVILTVPLLFLLNSLTKESQFVYIKTKQIFTTGDILSLRCAPEDESMLCRVSDWAGDFLSKPNVRYHVEDSIKRLTTVVSKKASEFVFSIPTILLNIFVAFFTTFYLFRDGDKVIEKAKGLMPLKSQHQKKMLYELDETTYAIIYGSLLIAVIQGAVGAFGFFLFGISSPITWGILIAIFALVPFIGTAFIWLPVSAVLIVQGFSTNSQSTIMRGIGLLLFSAFVVASMDNLLKPYLIGKRAKIHPVLVLLGVLGGLALFGFIGFIIGPLVLALLITFLEIYEKEKNTGSGSKS